MRPALALLLALFPLTSARRFGRRRRLLRPRREESRQEARFRPEHATIAPPFYGCWPDFGYMPLGFQERRIEREISASFERSFDPVLEFAAAEMATVDLCAAASRVATSGRAREHLLPSQESQPRGDPRQGPSPPPVYVFDPLWA